MELFNAIDKEDIHLRDQFRSGEDYVFRNVVREMAGRLREAVQE